MVHGYGADGEDLIGLAEPLSRLMPGAAFVAPNAPYPCPGARFMWFPITDLNPSAMHMGVTKAAPLLQSFIESELQRHSLTADRLALVGFSQGTMLSLHLTLGGLNPAAIVGFSGVLTGPAKPQENIPPVFLAHGTADQVIPVDALFMTAGALAAAGARVQWHLTPGMGHGIDEEGLSQAGSFLKHAFAGRLAAQGPASSLLR
jgi:phospholipase/carboxylesterase